MPPARPRLVEEGVPLTDGDLQDHNANDVHTMAGAPSPASAAAPTLLSHLSSLSRASVAPTNRRKSATRTRLVIGGEGDQDEMMMDTTGSHQDDDSSSLVLSSSSYWAASIPSACHDHSTTTLTNHPDNSSSSSLGKVSSSFKLQKSLVIGQMDTDETDDDASQLATHRQQQSSETYERMEGVILQGPKQPLVVLDGANVAYAYSNVRVMSANTKVEPDSHGIVVVAAYFRERDVRVLVVLPAPWLHHGGSRHAACLKNLQGQIVTAPSRDDDDAYAMTIARREDGRTKAYVVSNDMFRDAIKREPSWGTWLAGHRISYAFGDMGSHDDYGDPLYDFIPNPRHELIQAIERKK